MGKYFDILAFLMGKQAGGGGGGDITVESKSISSNGTYTAPANKAYSPVTVSVPNSYAAGDEGKVVSNGELVAQSSDSVTQNGTVDTTLINSLLVNVSGAGGGLTLLAEDEVTVNTTSTTATDVKTISIPGAWLSDKILLVVIKDKAGGRAGYFYGNVLLGVNTNAKRGITTAFDNFGGDLIYQNSSGLWVSSSTTTYGVYAGSLTSSDDLKIRARYSSTFGTINGTYSIKVYAIDIDPFS